MEGCHAALLVWPLVALCLQSKARWGSGDVKRGRVVGVASDWFLFLFFWCFHNCFKCFFVLVLVLTHLDTTSKCLNLYLSCWVHGDMGGIAKHIISIPKTIFGATPHGNLSSLEASSWRVAKGNFLLLELDGVNPLHGPLGQNERGAFIRKWQAPSLLVSGSTRGKNTTYVKTVSKGGGKDLFDEKR